METRPPKVYIMTKPRHSNLPPSPNHAERLFCLQFNQWFSKDFNLLCAARSFWHINYTQGSHTRKRRHTPRIIWNGNFGWGRGNKSKCFDFRMNMSLILQPVILLAVKWEGGKKKKKRFLASKPSFSSKQLRRFYIQGRGWMSSERICTTCYFRGLFMNCPFLFKKLTTRTWKITARAFIHLQP